MNFVLTLVLFLQNDGTPSTTMGGCLLYKLHSNGLVPGVEVDRNRFREVFMSKYRKVRIYKVRFLSASESFFTFAAI
jgi:hypothetical protein